MRAAAGMRPDENAAFLLHHPVTFLTTVGRTIAFFRYEYLEQFVGKLGRLEIRLPGWIPLFYVLLLFVVASAYRTGPRLSRSQRILLAGIFLLNAGSVFAIVWTTDMPHDLIASNIDSGRGHMSGIYGRYLIPYAFLPLIAVSGLFGQIRRGWIAVAAFISIAAVNIVALQGVWNTFQARSSTIPNRLRLAASLRFSTTPQTAALVYDNRVVSSQSSEKLKVYLVSRGAKHEAPNTMAVTKLGYKWADDVVLISDEDLAAIPSGDPLPAPKSYEGKLVRRPGSGVEDAKVYVILNGQKHWVWDGHWITGHGYKWPDDVNVIPADDLSAIPVGNSIP